jgi:hypothetical protein
VTAGGDPSLKKPTQAQQLTFYGLFKQVEKGKCTEKQPSRLQLTARAKHDAWAKLGKSVDTIGVLPISNLTSAVCSRSSLRPPLSLLPTSLSKADAQAQYVEALTRMDPSWESKAGKIKSKL